MTDEQTKTKGSPRPRKPERVQLTKRWNGHIVGETFTKADAERLEIPEDALRPFSDDDSTA